MLYIKIGENKYPIVKFNTFITQLGNVAVRIIGDDVPLAQNGFEIVDDDNVIGDMSEFTYLYREDESCKEYTKVAEEIIPTESFYVGDYPVDPIQKQINALNRRVSEITPFEQTKTAYYGEIEKVFYGVPDGVLNVTFDKYDGEYTVNRIDDRVVVSFPRLEDKTDITVMVQ